MATNIHDQKKLARVVNYLRHITYLHLVLSTKGTGILKWWVDGVFVVHPGMRSYTVATLVMGSGSTYSVSTKQKLNTQISIKVELVVVYNVLS